MNHSDADALADLVAEGAKRARANDDQKTLLALIALALSSCAAELTALRRQHQPRDLPPGLRDDLDQLSIDVAAFGRSLRDEAPDSCDHNRTDRQSRDE